MLVSRIGGAKILLLAVAVSAIALARQAGALPAWTVCPDGVLAVALT